MSSEIQLETIRKIKKTHENLVVVLGITIGIILGIYFFIFSHLIDSGPPIAIQFLMATTVLLVLALIYVKRLALLFTRVLLGRNEDCKALLKVLVVADLVHDETVLMQQLEQRRA